MIINKSGVAIRMGMDDLRVLGRITQGVRLINLKNNDEIAAVAKVMMDKEVEEETEETAENNDQGTQNQAPLESHEDTLNKNEEE
jgi:DNA gyrase subunit A